MGYPNVLSGKGLVKRGGGFGLDFGARKDNDRRQGESVYTARMGLWNTGNY